MIVATKLAATLALGAGLAAAPDARAETADLSSIFKAQGRPMEVDEGRIYWRGIYWGGSFNNAGAGFGHRALWRCPVVSEIADGALSGKGYCVMTEPDGDKVFGSFDGEGQADGLFEGTQHYTGGTGKYEGITGGHSFQCEVVNMAPRDASLIELSCIQEVEYSLPGDRRPRAARPPHPERRS